MGQPSIKKRNKRANHTKIMKPSSGDQENSTNSKNAFGIWIENLSLRAASYVATLMVGIVLTLFFNPFFARLFSRRAAVTVSYTVMPFSGSNDCNFYTIAIHPANNKSTIKKATLHIQFPAEIQSYIYGTDQTTQDGKPAIGDRFDFEPPCSVKPPNQSDIPSNLKITEPGQARRQIMIATEDLDPSSSFMLVVGVLKAQDPKLTFEGRAEYSAWNVDVDAPIDLVWLNKPR